MRKHLLENHPLPDGLEPIPDDSILPPRWSLEPVLVNIDLSTNAASPSSDSLPNTPPESLLSVPNSWTASLVSNTRETPDSHAQDVRLIAFDVPSSRDGQKLQVNPGDCLTIFPRNFPHDVQKLITLMQWSSIADTPLTLSSCSSLPHNLHVAPITTLRTLLLDNIDITATPRRSFLKNMAYFATDDDHRERLLEFNQPEYLDEYFDYATRSRRTILEVLEEFTSVRIPAERLLDVFPLIRGRDFSIANGGAALTHPTDPNITRVDLLIALVRYQTVLRRPRHGLCSRYLAALPPGAVLAVAHKPVLTPIHGVSNAQRPLIAIATGTGIAPVRSLIHERLTHSLTSPPAPTLLFFGNRNAAADFFFSDEWRALGDNLHVFTAFSRDQREKIYIQDILRREAARLAELIPQRAIFAVCGGSSKMAEACKHAVFDTYTDGGSEDKKEERKSALAGMTWWQEIW